MTKHLCGLAGSQSTLALCASLIGEQYLAPATLRGESYLVVLKLRLTWSASQPPV